MAGVVKKRELTKKADNALLENTIKKTAPAKKLRGTRNLAQKIETMRDSVEAYLGSKRNDYRLITEESELKSYIDSCVRNGWVSIDTETTSLDTLTCEIVGFSLYTESEKPCYVPLNHVDYITNEKIKNQISEDVAGKQLNRVVPLKTFFFNADFDIRVIRHTLGVYITPYYDAYIAARLLNENEKDNGLKALHKKYVLNNEEDAFSFSELFDKTQFNLVPLDVAYLYAARDALITKELADFQMPFLDVNNPVCAEYDLKGVSNVFWNIEMPIVTIIADMEDRGVKFDFAYQKVLSDEYAVELKESEEKFYECLKNYTDKVYSVSSPKQLAELFYDDLKLLKPFYDRKTGEYKRTVNVDALSSIDHPLSKMILDFRSSQKLVSTYVDKMAGLAERDGRVHGLFNQVGTDTGRFSSSDPNLQNIPSHNTKIRKMFIPSDGYVMIGGDFSAQEVRIVADLCGDKKMIEAYRNGKDLYCEIASMAFHVPYEDCLEFNPDGSKNPEGKERRSIAKKIVLSINYGKGIKSLAEDLGKTVDEAKEIYNAVMEEFPDLKRFIEDSKKMAVEKGFVDTKFGRKRRLPDVQLPHYEFQFRNGKLLSEESEIRLTKKLDSMWFKDKVKYIEQLERESGVLVKDNSGFIARAERQCVNARVQGTAADCTKIVMYNIATDKTLNECGFKMLLQVHDEIIGECPIETAKVAKERVKYIMEHSMDEYMQVPMKSDIECTDRWYGETVEL